MENYIGRIVDIIQFERRYCHRGAGSRDRKVPVTITSQKGVSIKKGEAKDRGERQGLVMGHAGFQRWGSAALKVKVTKEGNEENPASEKASQSSSNATKKNPHTKAEV